MRITEIVAARGRIPTPLHFANFWYNVSSIRLDEHVAKETTKRISAALELVSEKVMEKAKTKMMSKQVKLPRQIKV